MAPRSISTNTYPLHNTTFQLHRVSPLYTNTNIPLSNTQLAPLARRFRDVLAGVVLRGVRVGLVNEDDPLARVGALQTVTWEVLKDVEQWLALREEDDGEGDTHMNDDDGAGGGKGMIVQVKYEKAVYTAILLRDRFGQDAEPAGIQVEQDGFQKYPLLLTRMPVSLRDSFTRFLATNFDVGVSRLTLLSRYLTAAFERYIQDVGTEEEELTDKPAINARALRGVIKDVQFTITFDLRGVSAALKTVDVMIDRDDVQRMVAQGKQMNKQGSPFLEAFSLYVKTHFALNTEDERVNISKIACGAFVLGDGRLKLMQPPNMETFGQGQGAASRNLMSGLVELAMGAQILRAREIPPT